MSWIEGFDPTAWDLSSPGSVAYTRGALISAGVGAGASANQILSALTQAGIGIRRSQGLSLVAAEQGRQAAVSTAAQLAFDSSSGQLLPGAPPENWTGQYVHQVTATFRTTDEAGNYEMSERTMGIKASNTLSPQEAAEAAMSILETPVAEEDADTYGTAGNLINMQLSGVWYDTAPGVLGRIAG